MSTVLHDPHRIAAVRAAVDQLFEVVAKADIDQTMALMLDRVPHADQGTLKTHRDLEAAYGVLYQSLDRVEFDRTHCEVHLLTPHVAYVIAAGTYTTVAKDGSRMHGPIAWTYVWREVEGCWKLEHMHQSLQQPLPERVFRPETQAG